MAKTPDHQADIFELEDTGGFLSGFLAEEHQFDRSFLWRLGSWGVAAVGAVIAALLASHVSTGLRREQSNSANVALQLQQALSLNKESRNETRQLASTIVTLSSDRDRLYSRVTALETNLDSVTGAIARQASTDTSATTTSPSSPAAETQSAVTAPPSAPAPVVASVATTSSTTFLEKPTAGNPVAEKSNAEKSRASAVASDPAPVAATSVTPEASKPAAASPATPLVASKSIMSPPDPAATRFIQAESAASSAAATPEVVGSIAPAEDAEENVAPVAVQRTEFAVDVGSANSLGGLRALWRGLLKSNTRLAALHPAIVVKESRTGLGMQLRLVAGPLGDAAAAAKICAGLIANDRSCETTVFDGQRLAMTTDEPAVAAPKPAKPVARRRSSSRRAAVEQPAPKPEPSTLSTWFSRR